MAIAIGNTELSETFDSWRIRTNQIAYAMSANVVTGGGSPAYGKAVLDGSLVVGNSSVNAYINSTSFSIINSTAQISVSNPTAYQIANNQYFLNANSNWSIVVLPYLINNTVSTTGTGAQLIDSFIYPFFNSADYLINIKDTNDANNNYTTKLLVMNIDSNTFITDYGGLLSSANCGVFSANANTTHVKLYLTPTSSAATVKYTRVTA